MVTVREPWQKFEDLVKLILEARGFSVIPHSPRGDAGYDFDGVLENERWSIEVKYYRTDRAQLHLIEAAAARVVPRRRDLRGNLGMLVVSCSIPPAMRSALEEKSGVIFIDRLDLDTWVSGDPVLTEQLQSLLGSNLSPFLSDEELREDPLKRIKPSREELLPAEDTRGTKLCEELRSIKAGKSGWPRYEKVCVDILKYLFEEDLEGWRKQSPTDDGLNRFDLACRIVSEKFFWKFIVQSLNSVYVLFEFKNYTDKITQGQILTTEKYLLERASRRVGIILTRKGPDAGAIRMTQGAMREHGKLMLVIDDDAVCKMLHLKERGDDPTDFLFELADSFMLSLPR